MLIESSKRSFVKSVSYRIFGTMITIGVTYALTKKMDLSVAAGILDILLKMVLYFFHERVWSMSKYGLVQSRGAILWFTGLSGAGKTTLSKKLFEEFKQKYFGVVLLDGDQIRKHFPQLGYSRHDRNDHIKRVALMASELEKQGHIVLVALISPHAEGRYFARENCQNFHEIYLSASLVECEKRDVKGLYSKARAGEIKNMTGIDDVYEEPKRPELKIDTGELNIEESIHILKQYIKRLKKNI